MNPRHADFQSFFRGLRGLSINHLQRLADPFPGSPRHNPGTPNLSWSHLGHEVNETRIPVAGNAPLTGEGPRRALHIWDEELYPKILTSLFREAEDRGELDRGAFLRRVIALQDALVELLSNQSNSSAN